MLAYLLKAIQYSSRCQLTFSFIIQMISIFLDMKIKITKEAGPKSLDTHTQEEEGLFSLNLFLSFGAVFSAVV